MWTAGIGGRPAIERQAAAEPVPSMPAAGERVQRLDDLVARAERVGERVEPDVDPRPDVVDQRRTSSALPMTNRISPMTT